MVDSIQEKLERERLEVSWSALRPHVTLGRVLWVARGLSLGEVGEGLAQDNKPLVAEWLASSLLLKPSQEQVQTWDQESERLFWMVIVQPFVLMQEMTEDEHKEVLERHAKGSMDA